MFYRLVCLRRCLLEDSGVGALVSSLKVQQAREEVVPEVLREEVAFRTVRLLVNDLLGEAVILL